MQGLSISGQGERMTESMWQFISYLFTLVFVAAVIEIILSARWSQFYFTVGVPIYRRTIAAPPDAMQILSPEQMEAALPPRYRLAPILFRRIGTGRLAFREKLFHFGVGYSPVMRGIIKYDNASKQIEIVGFLNWYIMLFAGSFLLFLLLSPLDSSAIIITLCMAVLLAYIYWMQRKRFREVEYAVLKLPSLNHTN